MSLEGLLAAAVGGATSAPRSRILEAAIAAAEARGDLSEAAFLRRLDDGQGGVKPFPSGRESVLEVPPSTACKHGRLSCEACGTSDRRDAVHTTQGGAGKVARLRRSR